MMYVAMRTFYPIRAFWWRAPTLGRTMRRRLLPLLTIPAVLAVAPAAEAALVTTDRVCYLQSSATRVTVNGSNFTPSVPYSVLIDGQALPTTGTMSPTGTMTGTLTPPPLASDEAEQTFRVGVQTPAEAADAAFTVTKLIADFSPSKGNPRSLKVRFSVHGFSLRDESDATVDPTPDVYVHYVRPNGRLKRTLRIGTARGPCGTILRTAKRRLFPFTAERGTWKLQFDTQRDYVRGTSSSPFLFYTVGVRIRKVTG
jgi:hypothetical protein